MSLTRCCYLFLVLMCAGAISAQHPRPGDNHSPDFQAMQQKIAWLKQNAAKSHPDPKPVDLTEPEVNAYFNQGGVKLPKGVSHVRLTSTPAVLDAHAQIDFEAITQGRGANNPLYSLFAGTHDIHAVAQASGAHGSGSIHVQSVELDGIQIPEFALQWFVQRYLTPKYPNVGITSTFRLPLRIDSAVVGTGLVHLIQR